MTQGVVNPAPGLLDTVIEDWFLALHTGSALPT